MHLSTAPLLVAEVPGCAQEELDRLARSVEARRQQLEEDINAYIARKQEELQRYESELVEQLCSSSKSMERADADDEDTEGASSRRSSASQASDSTQTERTEDAAAAVSPHTEKKQKKHGRVHKREKELYGLVTPVFLPLLDARETTSPEKGHHHHHHHHHAKPPGLSTESTASTPTSEPVTPASDAPQSGTPSPKPDPATGAMLGKTPTPAPAPVLKERSLSDPGKKSRRSSIKRKSALRHNSTSITPRNRKRVSLVIDDVVVLPSDMIQEPVLMSPSSETTSVETSIASLDDLIDPRLTADTDGPVYTEHSGTVHHSLTPGVNLAMTSIPVVSEAAHSPPTPEPRLPPATAFAPPSYATRTFLDPAPERLHMEESAGPEAILASPHDELEKLASLASTTPADDPDDFQTYVGGISGSGVADVNQVGSVGYPSSLGASYLESYMQGRPLSVRISAAEREGDSDELRRLRGMEERRKVKEREKEEKRRIEEEDEWEKPAGGKSARNEDDDGFMGSMDDF
ncbi:hypothetical protein G6514_005743 [Epicoccum nigrum]|nr:hypothetical protein G6514_005743 [Epicoccum nigrum]